MEVRIFLVYDGVREAAVSDVLVIDDSRFEQEVSAAAGPVLAYFWAPWCGPCRLVSPSVEAIASDYGDRLKVVKLEVDPNPNAVKQCKVEGVPALRIFKNKEMVADFEGAITKDKLRTFVAENL
ncbi:MAG: thioredoxin family protein [Spirulinaceae cyanobacterium]